MMQIREARLGDAHGIATVHVASWRTTYRGIVPDDYLASLSIERRAAYWTETLKAGSEVIYVAEDEMNGSDGSEHIVGFASGGAYRDSDFPGYDGELYAIYLLHECQGRGIGQRLASALAQRLTADGFTAMLLWVLAENASRGFYERLSGQLLGEKAITIGGKTLMEVAYGWPDLNAFLSPTAQDAN